MELSWYKGTLLSGQQKEIDPNEKPQAHPESNPRFFKDIGAPLLQRLHIAYCGQNMIKTATFVGCITQEFRHAH